MGSTDASNSNNQTNRSAIRYMDTTRAYDLWAEVYDTDDNFLQALDSIEMRSLLPSFIAQISTPQPWTLVDLGCGTGRNTAALLAVAEANVVGLDASPNMLKVAQSRLQSKHLLFKVFDMLTSPPPEVEADAVISTLVLEHVPIAKFFQTAAGLLRTEGKLLVTNMHADMGVTSQAGFVDHKTGEKIRPKSYTHRIDDVVAEAKEYGFELIGKPMERSVDGAAQENLGPRAKKWVGVTVWFAVMFRKLH